MPQATMNTTPRRKTQLSLTEYLSLHLRKGGNLPAIIVAATIFIFALAMYGEDIKALALQIYKSEDFAPQDDYDQSRAIYYPPMSSSNSYISVIDNNTKAAVASKASDSGHDHSVAQHLSVPESCDISNGYWVFDNVTMPLYKEDQCEFMSIQVSCIKNGRQDDMYQKWRWKPNECSLPRFDARLFLERLRGKRLMFIGDSLNRNQWESLVCMIQPVLTKGTKNRKSQGSRLIFLAEEYNASIEFYWAPFLVESNSDDPKIHSIDKRIIKPESIEKHAKYWKDVDYLVFNTYIWWMNTLVMRVLRIKTRNWTKYEKINRVIVYERVLKTWSNWIEQNVDPKRTLVFFMSMSPLHINKQWGNPNGVKCAKETEPITNMTVIELGTDMKLFDIARKVSLSTSKVPINFIDITKMSNYRKDAHTSVYTVRQGSLLTKEQQSDPQTYADCIHWCTPGLPDTWNELLYARIMSDSSYRCSR